VPLPVVVAIVIPLDVYSQGYCFTEPQRVKYSVAIKALPELGVSAKFTCHGIARFKHIPE